MKSLIESIIKSRFMYIALLLVTNMLYALDEEDDPLLTGGGGDGWETVNPPQNPGGMGGEGLGGVRKPRATSLDIYEEMLLGTAVLLIVGYFLYKNYRRYSRLLK